MPSFIDQFKFEQAMHYQAIPFLEAMAINENLRSLRRFERDGPPPYVSSTESEEFDLNPPPRDLPITEELKAVMDCPISDDEVERIASKVSSIARPETIYHRAAWREEYRLDSLLGARPHFLGHLDGVRRQGVIVRHNVKRCWEKMGVWNPAWGFAGRRVKPSDRVGEWTWRWEPKEWAEDKDCMYDHARQLVARAVRLRQNLRRGERAPVVAQSALEQGATAAQAEAFLISRPWFIFKVEVAEESCRYNRLSKEDRDRHPYSPYGEVLDWWKERGDWRDEFERDIQGLGCMVTNWKWREESPSPEPEDLSPIDKIEESPLEVKEEMEFTPSEIDQLETIELPRSEWPEGLWGIKEIGDWPPYCPGQMHDEIAEAMDRRKREVKAEGREIQVAAIQPTLEDYFKTHFPPFLCDHPQAEEPEKTSPDDKRESLEEQGSSRESQEDSPKPQDSRSPLPRRYRHVRQCRLRKEEDHPQGQNQPDPQLPRRSARIAAMRQPLELLLSEAASTKRSKRGAAEGPMLAARKSRRITTMAGTKRPAESLPSQMTPNKRPRGRTALNTTASAVALVTRETRSTRTRIVPARASEKKR